MAGSASDMRAAGRRFSSVGRAIALVGIVAPLLLIGGMKFTQVEIDTLRPMIAATPWLSWMIGLFGDVGASCFLGVFEIMTAAFLVLSPWSARAGIVGGALAAFTFLVTCSLMVALPIWDAALGFPALGPLGQFLIKDVALLGISLAITGESLSGLMGRRA